MKRNWKRVAVGMSGVAIVVAAFVAGRALAGGIPAMNALSYAGTLADATGTPLTGSHNVEVKLWNIATGGTMALCTTNPQAVVLQGGRFSLPLPDGCTAVVAANPDIWVEVLDGGMSLGRTKAGAVPYAMEAAHAMNATIAATANGAGGTLLEQVVPSGAVMFFNLAACPTGWSDATAARGRYLVGLPANGTIAGSVGTALSDQENRPVGQHTHTTVASATGISINNSKAGIGATDTGHSHGPGSGFSCGTTTT